MRRYLITILVALLGAAVLAGAASTAAPTKGGTYQGELFATSAVALPKKTATTIRARGRRRMERASY